MTDCREIFAGRTNLTDMARMNYSDSDLNFAKTVASINIGSGVSLLCLSILGVIGNSVVIYCVHKFEKSSITDIFVGNLAIADFLFSSFLPVWAVERFYQGIWIMSEFICEFATFISLLNLYASVALLMVMSVDRYFAVVYPLKAIATRTKQLAWKAITVAWVVASGFAAKAFFFRKVVSCMCGWQFQEHMSSLYFVFRITVGFILPVAVIIYCYIKIFLTVSKRHDDLGSDELQRKASDVRGNYSMKRRHSIRDIRFFHNANKKLTRTAFCIIIAFLVCWTPNQILNVVYTFNPSYATYHVFIITSKLSEILAMCNSCVTPLVYIASKPKLPLKILNSLRGKQINRLHNQSTVMRGNKT
ncbi:Oidioi.mRNA.OKI2018_I69.PAR.g11046.t1.cds [Oikopleura dioica]|uniref:Oidioi.mRNA.OKI2018_I69.PAR.g11046.t1.cds n=1 Tax=Oikopleura dioica TaxID=34765 RepID=A0ABN7RTQ7_OIKDI|nr:Oidioi.mRNA.OKI2018_I69.PAR.g11046.t1.cds [Oikopleura dioica]